MTHLFLVLNGCAWLTLAVLQAVDLGWHYHRVHPFSGLDPWERAGFWYVIGVYTGLGAWSLILS